ncbi:MULTISPECIES: hypothetical protein [Calothrix]|uniref:Uncharacterized protein n=2 Tax=Calothrix TaxID=1186 RepID=A0ABR8AE73_9CYAN|nr:MULTISPECIES: hypothetical protein [Calothrix]MBD2196837.1 hypothetical protein [Calothrix parietina FACHB-288]MBD2225389.1 hypothetical protein [Calothrix anomala FACHB-343]
MNQMQDYKRLSAIYPAKQAIMSTVLIFENSFTDIEILSQYIIQARHDLIQAQKSLFDNCFAVIVGTFISSLTLLFKGEPESKSFLIRGI